VLLGLIRRFEGVLFHMARTTPCFVLTIVKSTFPDSFLYLNFTYEIICDLKYNNAFLAIPIFNKHKEESRLDLCSSITLDCMRPIHIHGRYHCCSINGDQ
jgi:hypothetical protein